MGVDAEGLGRRLANLDRLGQVAGQIHQRLLTLGRVELAQYDGRLGAQLGDIQGCEHSVFHAAQVVPPVARLGQFRQQVQCKASLFLSLGVRNEASGSQRRHSIDLPLACLGAMRAGERQSQRIAPGNPLGSRIKSVASDQPESQRGRTTVTTNLLHEQIDRRAVDSHVDKRHLIVGRRDHHAEKFPTGVRHIEIVAGLGQGSLQRTETFQVGTGHQRATGSARGREKGQTIEHVTGAGERFRRLQADDRVDRRQAQPSIGMFRGLGQRRGTRTLPQQTLGRTDAAEDFRCHCGRREVLVGHGRSQQILHHFHAKPARFGNRRAFVGRQGAIQAVLIGGRFECGREIQLPHRRVVRPQRVRVPGKLRGLGQRRIRHSGPVRDDLLFGRVPTPNAHQPVGLGG